MYRELQGCMSIYFVHACMIPICLGTSYQVHSYLFSFFMRESFSSCMQLIPVVFLEGVGGRDHPLKFLGGLAP